MKKLKIFLLVVLLINGILYFSCSLEEPVQKEPEKAVDLRAPLVGLMDQYLEALLKHDPAGLPLASNVKLVENTKEIPIGKGLWETSTGDLTTDYKIYVADPVLNQIGFMGVIERMGKPIQLGVRLKLEKGKITEIDHMVWLLNDPLSENLMKLRPALTQKLDESERVSREEMVKAAMAYYDAIEQNDGTVAPFADECRRHEGGMVAANNPEPLPEDGESDFGPMAAFGRMKCGEQLSTGIMRYISDINQRRLVAVDEEMGLVMIFSMFNHDGEPNPLPIKNVDGITESPNEWGQFNVGAAHISKIRNGKIYEMEIMATIQVPPYGESDRLPYQASDGWSCTRKCLVEKMDQYLAGLAKNDPTGVPLAEDVKLVENTKKTPIGEGLWKTATGGPTDFKIIVADPVSGETAFMGVIDVNKQPTIAAIRLKVVDHKIKEIDHLIVHGDGSPLHPNMSKVRTTLLERQPKLERISRERMIAITNSYYESILQNKGDVAPFADECQRRENGGTSVGKKAGDDDGELTVFNKMKCGEQTDTGIWSYITDITDRRILAIDEEKGLAFAFSIFRHDGEPKVMKIKGVPGVTERKNDYGAFDLPAAHVFKIRNGKFYEIEAIGYMADHGITNGWE
ncbi:hypothetical protein ACFL1N_07390 [Thermodesulfobacteriota bacterium]